MIPIILLQSSNSSTGPEVGNDKTLILLVEADNLVDRGPSGPALDPKNTIASPFGETALGRVDKRGASRAAEDFQGRMLR